LGFQVHRGVDNAVSSPDALPSQATELLPVRAAQFAKARFFGLVHGSLKRLWLTRLLIFHPAHSFPDHFAAGAEILVLDLILDSLREFS
jgi:hypothetical protein